MSFVLEHGLVVEVVIPPTVVVDIPALPGPVSTVPGPPNILSVGTVDTVESDVSASVVITGESPDQVVSFDIPKGLKGDPGTDSVIPGPSNVLSIGTVDTVESDIPASVVITGESPDQVLSFDIPKGFKGDPGTDSVIPGPPNVLSIGTVDTVNTDIPASVVITGESPDQMLSFAIPKGLKGDPGTDSITPGPPNVLSIGTVDTVESNIPASVVITGESPDQTLLFAIPKGLKGDPGTDSFISGPPNVLSIGTVDTVEPDVPAAVVITGESPDQVLSFDIPKGLKGDPGDPGTDSVLPGPPNVLSIGTVDTVEPDIPAAVVITGVSPNQTLSFDIPKGLKGDPGTGGSGGTGSVARTIAVITTSILELNEEWIGFVTMGKAWRLYQIVTDRATRVRLYSSIIARDADLGRLIGTDPSGDHGLMVEFISTPVVLGAVMSPMVDGAVMEDPVTDQVPVAVKNLSTVAAVVVTLIYQKTE